MPKTEKHRLPGRVVEILNDALESAEMKNASFDFADKNVTITIHRDNDGESTEFDTVYKNTTITDFIRERTRLYRQSWIIARINEVLTWSKTKDDGSIEEYDVIRRLKASFPHPDSIDDTIAECEKLREENAELRSFKSKVSEATKTVTEALEGLG